VSLKIRKKNTITLELVVILIMETAIDY